MKSFVCNEIKTMHIFCILLNYNMAKGAAYDFYAAPILKREALVSELKLPYSFQSILDIGCEMLDMILDKILHAQVGVFY